MRGSGCCGAVFNVELEDSGLPDWVPPLSEPPFPQRDPAALTHVRQFGDDASVLTARRSSAAGDRAPWEEGKFTVPGLPAQARCARPRASPQSISRPALAQARWNAPDQDGAAGEDLLEVPDQDVNKQGALGRSAGTPKVPQPSAGRALRCSV